MTDAWRGPTRACMSPRCDHTFSLAAWYSIHDGVCVCVCVCLPSGTINMVYCSCQWRGEAWPSGNQRLRLALVGLLS